MRLKGKIVVTEPYKGKTKFDFWSGLKVDDVLRVSLVFNPRRGSNGIYSPETIVYNTTTHKSFKAGMGEIGVYLGKIEYKEYTQHLTNTLQ